jgi:hypothetical protein
MIFGPENATSSTNPAVLLRGMVRLAVSRIATCNMLINKEKFRGAFWRKVRKVLSGWLLRSSMRKRLTDFSTVFVDKPEGERRVCLNAVSITFG